MNCLEKYKKKTLDIWTHFVVLVFPSDIIPVNKTLIKLYKINYTKIKEKSLKHKNGKL